MKHYILYCLLLISAIAFTQDVEVEGVFNSKVIGVQDTVSRTIKIK